MRYDYRLRITRTSEVGSTGGGTQDSETGVYDAPGTGTGRTVVLDCPADVQDAGESIPRNAAGMPWLKSDATVFIPPSRHEDLMAVVPNDVAEVFYPNSDRTAEGNVAMVRDFDDALLLVYR